MHCGTVFNTTNIYINSGRPSYGCMPGMPSGMMFGCFPPPIPPTPAAMFGAACGYAAAPLIPGMFKAIGQGIGWFASKVIAPAATFVWNSAIKPVGKFMWNDVIKPVGSFMWNNVIKPVGNFAWNSVLKPAGSFLWNSAIKPAGKFLGKVGSSIGKGVSKLWHSIFHKKSKTESKPAEQTN